MPHLSKLSKTYEGQVTFLALSNEKEDKVRKFLGSPSGIEDKTWGEAMTFVVATDPDLSAQEDLFQAAAQQGFPTSYIISKGKLQWIGHPMGIDTPLERVVNGTWGDKEIAEGRRKLTEAVEIRPILEELRREARGASRTNDWSKPLALLDRALKAHPHNSPLMMSKWKILLLQKGDYDQAYSFGKSVIEAHWNDAAALNDIGWTVVDTRGIKTRNLEFAMKAAARANELTKSADGAILDTLARVYFEQGDFALAVQWQRLAVKHSDGDLRKQLEEALQKYLTALKKSGGVKI